MNILNLESESLRYRKFNVSDYLDLYEILSNPNVCKYLPGETYDERKIKLWLNKFALDFDETKPNLVYAVTTKTNDKVIGYVGIAYVKEYDKPEILYGFNEDYWHKGYASEGSTRMKDLAIKLKYDSLVAFAAIDNLYSNKVLVKTGYDYIETIDLWGLRLKYYKMNLGGN